jgi:eukaryotic-like serine/threonine-protein kinase
MKYEDASTAFAATEAAEPLVSIDPDARGTDDGSFAGRYERGDLLGAGGMGEVYLSRDRRIGRGVAMKLIRATHAERSSIRARFEREARVQAQLEHPAVVPVYDIGLTPTGQTYFTMKRVRGRALDDVLAAVAAGDATAVATFTRRRLLTAFSAICLAMAYAHTRGVIHRDLKPANVMLGEFGEVNVLDWGIARVGDAPEDDADPLAHPTPAAKTEAGAVLGTPGYMAPEQLLGQAIDARTDVYALGAILFEILALTPLHQATTAAGLAASTLAGSATPSERSAEREIPPELDAICARATSFRSEDRYASARDLSDAVDRYLDGDRDLVMRRAIAVGHADRAARAAETAMSATGAVAQNARGEALREASRALAFDPAHAGALRTLVGLLVHAPTDLPPEAEAELADADESRRQKYSRQTAPVVGGLLLLTPLLFWMGIRSYTEAVVMGVGIALLAGILWFVPGRRPVSDPLLRAGFLLTTGMVISFTPLFGPLVLVPTVLVASTTMSLTSFGQSKGMRRFITGVGVAALIGSTAVSFSGIVAPSYAVKDGLFQIFPRALDFPPLPTFVFLFLTSLVAYLVSARMVGRNVEVLTAAERRLFQHAWHLRQLLPEEARRS